MGRAFSMMSPSVILPPDFAEPRSYPAPVGSKGAARELPRTPAQQGRTAAWLTVALLFLACLPGASPALLTQSDSFTSSMVNDTVRRVIVQRSQWEDASSMRTARISDIREHRKLLVLLHVPKTGGSTLQDSLAGKLKIQRCKLPTFGLAREDVEASLQCISEAHRTHKSASFAVKSRKIDCRACDFWSYEIKFDGMNVVNRIIPKGDALILTMVREPFAHVQSQLNHWIIYHHYPVPPNQTLHRWNRYILDEEHAKPPLGYIPYNMHTLRLSDAMDPGADPLQEVQRREFREDLSGRGLESAMKNLKSTVFWFGITEHFDASICLLLYQMRIFDRNHCKCNSFTSDSGSVENDVVHASNVQQGSSGYVEVAETYKKDIRPLIELDLQLYDFALALFKQRVREAEKAVGQRFLCE
mmetsp:Transcript_4423/g.15835  ORF Transcript_4423/g.15835 Transcript_4423/m.15835 type:complete len:415 (+) Transcript_4423:170-1414(+)